MHLLGRGNLNERRAAMESEQRSSSLREAKKLAGKKNTIPLDLAKALYEAHQVSEERMGQILAATGLKRRNRMGNFRCGRLSTRTTNR